MTVRSPVRGVVRSPIRSPASGFYGVSGYPGSLADLDFTTGRYIVGGSAKTYAELFTGTLPTGADGLEADGATTVTTTRTLLGMTDATEGCMAALWKAPSHTSLQRVVVCGTGTATRAVIFAIAGTTQDRVEYRDATGVLLAGGVSITPGAWHATLLGWGAADANRAHADGPPRTVFPPVPVAPARTPALADIVQFAGRDGLSGEAMQSGGRIARVICFAGPLSAADATNVIDFLGALRGT